MKKLLAAILLIPMTAMGTQWVNDGGDGWQTGEVVYPEDFNALAEWDAQIDISATATPCADINDAIAETMDNGSGVFKRIRVHHSGTNEVTLQAQSKYEDLGPQKSCIVIHPHDNISGGYPDTLNQGAVNLTADQGLFLYFDNIRPLVNESSLSENACFLDIGGGWLAGHDGAGTYYGSPGANVEVAGRINGQIVSPNAGSFDDESIPSNSTAARLNADSVSAHAWICGHRASDVQMNHLTVVAESNDDDDFVCHFTNMWGSSLPKCIAEGGEGVGIQFNGVINSVTDGSKLNRLDYGIVLGTPDKRGDVVFYSSCAGTCTEMETGVRGVTFKNGVVEGNTYANLVDIGSERRNVFRDNHWECDSGSCQLAGFLIKPHFCDGTTGSSPVAEDIPAIDDEATDCASSGGVSAAAPETSDYGALVFSGRTGSAGDSGLTESISPSFFMGEDFLHPNSVYITDGFVLQPASDSSNQYFTFHSSLTRAGQADMGDSLAASVGLIDTSGAHFAGSSGVFPANFDRWVDARERELFWFAFQQPASAGTEWAAGGLVAATSGTNECISLADWPWASTGSACTSSQVLGAVKFPHEVYFTRANVTAVGGFDTTESCALGFDTDQTQTDFDWQKLIQIPVANGQDLTANENYSYPLGFSMAPSASLFVEIGDGANSESGTPDCDGTFNARVGIMGFPFDPQE